MRSVRLFFFLCVLLCTSAWGMQWHKGMVTHDAWMDQGGYYVSVDGTTYLFMRTAAIRVDAKDHEVPDRLAYLTKGSTVRILKDGFRIYALEIVWRKMP